MLITMAKSFSQCPMHLLQPHFRFEPPISMFYNIKTPLKIQALKPGFPALTADVQPEQPQFN